MLAISKAGLAYLPMALEWPQGRLELLIDEVKPIFILTNVKADILHHAIAKTAGGRKPIHQISDLLYSAREEPKTNLPPLSADEHEEATPRLLAVLYTSG